MARPRRRVLADVELPEPDEHGRRLLTGAQAALVAGTTERNIRAWRACGWLEAAGQEPSGRRQYVYDYDAVLRADAIARGIRTAA